MFDTAVHSSDALFSRMLTLEFTGAGLTVGEPASVYVCDLDSCDASEIKRLGQGGAIVTFGYGGADFSRPFDVCAIIQRVRALSVAVKAPSSPAHEDDRLSFIDESRVICGGRVISLTPREYTVLRCLYESGDMPVSRQRLAAAVWGRESSETNVADVYIRYLREKLESDGRRVIITVRGKGYMLKQ